MLADMVTVGNLVADVGCDHGFLSIWLVQAGVSPRVLAMDVKKGPLAAAKEHIEEYGLGDYIEARLSDGLKNCEAGEAETLVCAGMGGRLMERILTESMEKVRGLKELILQPQSELQEFRAFLRREGFVILQEEAVCEEGKFYFAMKAVPGAAEAKEAEIKEAEASWEERYAAEREQRLYDRFGEKLLAGKNPVLLQYLQWRKKVLSQLVITMRFGDMLEAERAFGFGDPLGVGSVFGADEDRRAWGAFGLEENPEDEDDLEKGPGPERKRMRMDDILTELSDVNYALERMQ